MSSKALNYVLDHSKQKGSALVLMLVIADMANDNGDCFPGNANLAKKCRCTERNLQKLVDKCETDGELWVVENGGADTAYGKTNLYIIPALSLLTFEQSGARKPRPKRDVKSDTPSGGVTGDVSRGVKPDALNHQFEPNEEKENSSNQVVTEDKYSVVVMTWTKHIGDITSRTMLDEVKALADDYPLDQVVSEIKAVRERKPYDRIAPKYIDVILRRKNAPPNSEYASKSKPKPAAPPSHVYVPEVVITGPAPDTPPAIDEQAKAMRDAAYSVVDSILAGKKAS